MAQYDSPAAQRINYLAGKGRRDDLNDRHPGQSGADLPINSSSRFRHTAQNELRDRKQNSDDVHLCDVDSRIAERRQTFHVDELRILRIARVEPDFDLRPIRMRSDPIVKRIGCVGVVRAAGSSHPPALIRDCEEDF
jgi:hypothetical protein